MDSKPWIKLSPPTMPEEDFTASINHIADKITQDMREDPIRFAYGMELAMKKVADANSTIPSNTPEAMWLDGLIEATDRFKDYVTDLSAECIADTSVNMQITPVHVTSGEALNKMFIEANNLYGEYWNHAHPDITDLETQAMLRVTDDINRLVQRLKTKRHKSEADHDAAVDADHGAEIDSTIEFDDIPGDDDIIADGLIGNN